MKMCLSKCTLGRFYRRSLELLPLNSIPQLHFDLITSSRWEKVISYVSAQFTHKTVWFRKSFAITPSSLNGDQRNTERLLTDFVSLYNLFLLNSLCLSQFRSRVIENRWDFRLVASVGKKVNRKEQTVAKMLVVKGPLEVFIAIACVMWSLVLQATP